MKQQSTIQTSKQTMPPQTRGLLPHAAVHATSDHDRFSNSSAGSRFGHDFSQVAVHPSVPAMGQNCSNFSSPLRIQAKLKIGQPGDRYEQEADRVAEQVMRMPEPRLSSSVGGSSLANSGNPSSGTIHRVCAPCSAEYKAAEDENRSVESANLCPKCRTQGGSGLIQIKSARVETLEVTPAISSGIQSLQGGGRPLSRSERNFFEPRFGADFSGVRVHDDARAGGVARSINARAFTLGQDIVFGAGEYSSDGLAGKKLLAHELTHVVQQNSCADQSCLTPSIRYGHSSPGNTLQRDEEAPIENDNDEELTLRVNPNLIRLSLSVLRGEHRLGAMASLVDPLSIPLDLLGIDLGIDSSRLRIALSYNNRCNRAFQAALVEFEAGPFVEVTQVPWRISPRVSTRIGALRFDLGIGLGFEGSDFSSVLFTLNLAAASTDIPSECIVPPASTPFTEPGAPTTPQETPDAPITPTPARLPSYTLNFFYDTTFMRLESNGDFQRVVELLQNVSSLHVQLIGHTSLEGTDVYNQRLSEQRAEAVRDRLVPAGIDATRIHTLGMGEFAPAVTEPSVPGRSLLPLVERVRTLNRRVTVTFFDPIYRFEPRFPSFTLSTPGPAPSQFSLGAR